MLIFSSCLQVKAKNIVRFYNHALRTMLMIFSVSQNTADMRYFWFN